jgi:uncharacterized protein YciI
MFLVRLTYIEPLEAVDALIPAHREFLQEMYQAGTFLLSGRTEPRDGGIILASASSMKELQSVLARDPFQAVAKYQIIEFFPSLAGPAFQSLVAA